MVDVPADLFASICAFLLVAVWVWLAMLVVLRGRSSSSRPRRES